ncbi:ATP binding [Ascochyta rabiei]|uniref:DNA topoisomerase (ATP-hydrolyzing) n=1 Tax=Didymella rabiei TaxID=5454 RepID=A0A163KM41_DIDRA|nr:ATP binding [Ascochyta rabiei]
MDSEHVETLLFSLPGSQESFNNLWSEESDDEMLDVANDEYDSDDDLFDVPVQVTTDSWQLLSSPLLTAAETSGLPHDDLTMCKSGDASASDEALHVRMGGRSPRDRHWVISRLEAMLERIVDGLLEGSEKLTFTLKSRTGISRRQPHARDESHTIPAAKSPVLLRVIELIHGGLVDNTIMTKRDIYYKHADLFVKQAVVDRCVDDLACTFSISRSQLNVTAAAKGLVAGHFTITRKDETQVDGMNDKEGMLVPHIGQGDCLDLTQLHWILVIEKEATFRSVLSTIQWGKTESNGLAKGYPDIASRRFLRQLADHAPHIPMYAFADLDPDGIAIVSTYKHGSYRLAHEDLVLKDAPALSLPNIRWLGVKWHHISRTHTTKSDTDMTSMPELQGLMRLTARDRNKAARMLEWDLCSETGPEQEWRHELQTMLMLNTKAEMQILDELGGVALFLSNEIDRTKHSGGAAAVERACSEDGLLF